MSYALYDMIYVFFLNPFQCEINVDATYFWPEQS